MPRMKAAIFVEPSRIVLDEKPVPCRSVGRADPHHDDHDLRNGRTYPQGGISGPRV